MKKSDMKSYMIVINGYGDMLLLLEGKDIDNDWFVVGTPTEEELDEDISAVFYKEREFNDDLININDPIASITDVYDSIPLQFPFVLNVEDLYDKYKPELVWEREPSVISKSKLESFSSNKDVMTYISSIVPPYRIVE
jgi:hypothetical protein|nr:MAG TPA: hypothetical protein [Caudoviricetes sp.]